MVSILLLISFLLPSVVPGHVPKTFRIIIRKKARTLELFSDTQLVRTYPIALGTNPIDPKRKAGDRCTPEGRYFICEKNLHSHFYLSLGLSYPNEDDAAHGLRERRISESQYRLIVDAAQHHRKPPWNTPLGGEVMVHGGGTQSDWTWGCIALENANIKSLFDQVPIGTPVEIDP